MLQDTYTPPTPEQRRSILAEYGFSYDERIREKKCKQITSVSRATRYQLEKASKFPPRCHLGRNSCAWLLSEVLWWVRNPPVIKGVNNPHERKKEKEAGENAK